MVLQRKAGRWARAAMVCLGVGLPLPSGAEDGFARLEGHGGPVKGVAISPDGKQALTASFDYSAALWDLDKAEVLTWLDDHEAAVNAVAFLPGGKQVLTAGDDYTVRLWDLDTGEMLRAMEGHTGKIMSLKVSGDGRMVASSGWDGRVGLWDLTATAPPRWLAGHKSSVNDAVFTADGTQIYSASHDGTVRLWRVADGKSERTLVKHGFGVNHLVLNEDAGWLAYGAIDGAVRAIDLDSGDKIADLTADRRPVLALAANSDASRLAVGDGEGYVMIIDTAEWRIERDFHAAARGPVWALAWTRDGARVLSGGLDDAAVLWPVAASDAEVEGLLTKGERSFLRDPSEMTNGERQFARKCSICHTLDRDGRNRAGPTLWGLFGRPAGTVEGYTYSDALNASDIVWEAETINRLFDEGPDHYTPGSKMPMQRITGLQDRQDLIEFLAENTGPRSTATNGERKP